MNILSLSNLSNAFTSVKLAGIKTKYTEKKQKERELTSKERERQRVLQSMQEQAEQERKSAKISSIQSKFKSGGSLTPEEISYLRKESPGCYEELLNQRAEAESYEKALKGCKTKEDVSSLHMVKLSQFMTEANAVCNNPVIPKDKKLEIMLKLNDRLEGVKKVQTEFETSEEYARLPSMYDEEEEPKTEEPEDKKPENTEAMPADTDEKPADSSGKDSEIQDSQTESPKAELPDAKAEKPAVQEKNRPAPESKKASPRKKPVNTGGRITAEDVKRFVSFEIERLQGFKSKNVDVNV